MHSKWRHVSPALTDGDDDADGEPTTDPAEVERGDNDTGVTSHKPQSNSGVSDAGGVAAAPAGPAGSMARTTTATIATATCGTTSKTAA